MIVVVIRINVLSVADVGNINLVLVENNMENKTISYIAWGLVIVLALALFFYLKPTSVSDPVFVGSETDVAEEIPGLNGPTDVSWIDVELKDVITGETFRLSDFDKPILMESFAVWCPTCKKQQDQIQKLIDSGDDSIHVSINTDPNEDESRVAEHVNRYSYSWPFVVFPASATQMLIDDFGVGIVNAPRAPVLLICPDMTARLLQSGVKSAEELKKEIDKC